MSSLRIVVLAAGLSTRMGRQKLFEKIQGRSLIRRTIEELTPFAARSIIVIAAPRAARLRGELRGLRLSVIANRDRTKGLATSVARGLREVKFSGGVMFVPADLAELNGRDVARMLARWKGMRRKVIARTVAGQGAAPIIFPKFLYRKASALQGAVGLRDLVAQLPMEQRTLLDLPSAARDVDTPKDLASARRRAHRSRA